MVQFWVVALLMIVVAMATVALPLFARKKGDLSAVSDRSANLQAFSEQSDEIRRQQEQGLISAEEAGRVTVDLEKKLLDDVAEAGGESVHQKEQVLYGGIKSAILAAVLVPVLALPLYFGVGAYTEISATRQMNSGASRTETVALLERWVSKRPDNAQVWFMLGEHYLVSGDSASAVRAFQHLYQLTSGSSQASAQLAQALFLQDGNRITDKVRKFYKKALEKDDTNTTALGLAGIDAYEREDYPAAVKAWSGALQYESDPEARSSLAEGVTRARQKMGETVAAIRVNVQLAPELKELPPKTRVIVFARESGAKTPPLAAVPLELGELPREVVLDDSASMMMGATRLSDAGTLDIVARITLSGDVSKVDYQAVANGVRIDKEKRVDLVISPST